MNIKKFATSMGDRMLSRLMPGTSASAAPDCSVQRKLTSSGCGVGKLRLCKRQCCVGGSCTAWICGGCAVP